MAMKRSQRIRREFVAARKIWPQVVHGIQSDQLELLLKTYRFSVGRGDLQILGGRWYVTHMGLLGVAVRNRTRQDVDFQRHRNDSCAQSIVSSELRG
jgi:hypothetical protein